MNFPIYLSYFSPVTFYLSLPFMQLLETLEYRDLDATQIKLAYRQPPLRVASWRRACSRLRRNGAVTKWIRGWPKWDAWVSASTRKVDFRSLCHSFVRQRDAFTTSRVDPSLYLYSFFARRCRFSLRSSARPFPHVGLFAMTSDSVWCARRNIIVTFTQIAARYSRLIRTRRFSSPPLSHESAWILIVASLIIHWSSGSPRMLSTLLWLYTRSVSNVRF